MDVMDTYRMARAALLDIDPFVRLCLTGSRIIGGSHEDSDLDIVVLTADRTAFIKELHKQNWGLNEDDPDYTANKTGEIPFSTARKGDINLIIYDDEEGWNLWATATALAIRFKLTDRRDRIDLFRAIMNGRR